MYLAHKAKRWREVRCGRSCEVKYRLEIPRARPKPLEVLQMLELELIAWQDMRRRGTDKSGLQRARGYPVDP
eukprot:534568-Pleurochrysis_carterae.AAC.1